MRFEDRATGKAAAFCPRAKILHVASTRATIRAGAILRLLVRNHPGVMSHLCGLFARRAFNVEGISACPLATARAA